MTPSSPAPLTWKQRAFLVLVVPTFMLALLEVGARAYLFVRPSKTAGSQPMRLEMPTWMLRDANAVARATPSKDAFEWINLFVEGDGYRVHLIPNTSRDVKNTFSLIPEDASRRYNITSNSLGFRGPEINKEKGSDTFRILVFGDSSSFGWGVNAEDSWSVMLQQELAKRAPGKRIEVANFAIPGDSSAYGRLLFDTFAPQFQSDLVILGFGANDAKRVPVSHTEQVARFRGKAPLLAVSKVLRHSAIVKLIERVVQKKADSKGAEPPRAKVAAVTQSDYVENLHYMGAKAREVGNSNALLLTLCTPTGYARAARGEARRSDFLWFNGQSQLIKALPEIRAGKLYPEYVARMRSLYAPELDKNELFYITSDGCHPNELGHKFVADKLSEIIVTAGLLK